MVLAVQVRPPAPSNFKGLAPKGLSLLLFLDNTGLECKLIK
ncbi:hypothetical protein MTBPR1_60019 [Candidatus Terasakiella magnetica]|uniref:Uncharacterized protein n=1 Tax=Candidatus Terasakiella magnetica TaxID=1867952 RepID=A0A1C3RJQ6_9PROT|nr:hypothetical protein MTBPR1_60019 [Candidatus Terasakiella magnetica]